MKDGLLSRLLYTAVVSCGLRVQQSVVQVPRSLSVLTEKNKASWRRCFPGISEEESALQTLVPKSSRKRPQVCRLTFYVPGRAAEGVS